MNESDFNITLTIDGKAADKSVEENITAITYIDNDDEHADDLQIITSDGAAFAKDSRLTLQITAENWHNTNRPATLSCGAFAVDEIEEYGQKDATIIKAAAITAESTVRQNERCQAWEQVNLKEVADEIGNRNGVKVIYATDYNPVFVRREQLYKSDIRFLADICREAGLSLKFTANALVIYSKYEYSAKDPVKTFKKNDADVKSDRIIHRSNDTGYGKCLVRYNDPNKKELIEYTYIHKDEGRTLSIRRKVSSTEEAKRVARYAIMERNSKEYTGVIECEGDISLSTGNVVTLAGYGDADGNYIITKAVHDIRGNVYDTKIYIERALEGYE